MSDISKQTEAYKKGVHDATFELEKVFGEQMKTPPAGKTSLDMLADLNAKLHNEAAGTAFKDDYRKGMLSVLLPKTAELAKEAYLTAYPRVNPPKDEKETRKVIFRALNDSGFRPINDIAHPWTPVDGAFKDNLYLYGLNIQDGLSRIQKLLGSKETSSKEGGKQFFTDWANKAIQQHRYKNQNELQIIDMMSIFTKNCMVVLNSLNRPLVPAFIDGVIDTQKELAFVAGKKAVMGHAPTDPTQQTPSNIAKARSAALNGVAPTLVNKYLIGPYKQGVENGTQLLRKTSTAPRKKLSLQ